jgi:hypothetical protein
VIWEETWSLVWEWGSLTSVITGAPSASLAESGTSALPGLRALLGTLPVVGFRDGAVLVSWVSGSIFGPVSFPEFLGVVVVLSSGWDDSVSETDGWWGTSGNGSNECGDSSEFHDDRFIILLIINKCFIAINIIMAADTKLNINDFKLII